MNFRLTVLTGISDPRLCLAFDSHSLRAVMYVLTHYKSMDSTLADKVLKKTPLDLQKRFPIYHACPKYLAADCCCLAILLDHDKVEVTLERKMVHCVLTRHP